MNVRVGPQRRLSAKELTLEFCQRRLLGVFWTARRSNQVNPKGNQSWIFIGRTDTETEAPIFWPPDAKSWLIRKDPDAGKDWRQKEKGTVEDEMVREHRWLNIEIRIWANSGKCWRTGKPGVLQFMGLQRVWTWLSQQKTTINNVYVSMLLFQFIPSCPSLALSTSLFSIAALQISLS